MSTKARTLGSVSCAHPTRNEGSGVGTRGTCAEPLGRGRWWVMEMTITSSMNTFSNTGNIPTLHQPSQQSLSLPSHSLTGFPQWLSHIICLKFGLVEFILAGSTLTTYCKTLRNALGVNTECMCLNTIGNMYPAIWKRAVTTADRMVLINVQLHLQTVSKTSILRAHACHHSRSDVQNSSFSSSTKAISKLEILCWYL